MRESFPRQVDKESRDPQGERGLEFQGGRKDKLFFSFPTRRSSDLKLVRQHILLTLILRVSDPGAPSSNWRKLQQSQEFEQPFAA